MVMKLTCISITAAYAAIMALISQSVKDNTLHFDLFCRVTVSPLILHFGGFAWLIKYICGCEWLCLLLLLLFFFLSKRVWLSDLPAIGDELFEEYGLHVFIVEVFPDLLDGCLFLSYFGHPRRRPRVLVSLHQVGVVQIGWGDRLFLETDQLREDAHQAPKDEGCNQYYHQGGANEKPGVRWQRRLYLQTKREGNHP